MAIRPWNVIELCAGAGGLGLGIELAMPGARGVAYVEREAAAAAKLVHRMETNDLAPAPVWSDLATFDALPWRGRVHCVASGDPCQGNSVAGKRLGVLDDRFLIDQVIRVVDECRPLRVFRENVPGNSDGQLAALIPPLERLGYRVECGLFGSGETGNSHGRKRFFVMADAIGGAVRSAGSGPHARQASDAGGEARQQWVRSDAGERGANLGADLAHPERYDGDARPDGPGNPEGQGSDGDVGRSGVNVDDPARSNGRVYQGRGQSGQAAADAGRSGRELGNTDSADEQGRRGCSDALGRQEPHGHARLAGGGMVPLVMPGPDDPAWRDIIDRWQQLTPAIDKEQAERLLRGGFDALADRVDRLRLLGNGVDPVAAAYAWICLDAAHRAHRERSAGVAAMKDVAA